MPYRLTAEPGVWTWLDDHPDLAPVVEAWLFQLAGDPRPYVEVQFPDEPVPRQYAVVRARTS